MKDMDVNYRPKSELDVLIQDSGIGYTDLLLENLSKLASLNISGAKELYDRLSTMEKRDYVIRQDIQSPNKLKAEIERAYWFPFCIYNFKAICSAVIYRNEIKNIDEDTLLNKMYLLYKENFKEFITRLNRVLLVDKKELQEMSMQIEAQNMANKTKREPIKLKYDEIATALAEANKLEF